MWPDFTHPSAQEYWTTQIQTFHHKVKFDGLWIVSVKELHTVMILSFQTDMPGQTVQTVIRVYTVCHSVCIVWTHYSMAEPHSSNFRVITTNFLGVRIFRKFTVMHIICNHCHTFSSPSLIMGIKPLIPRTILKLFGLISLSLG